MMIFERHVLIALDKSVPQVMEQPARVRLLLDTPLPPCPRRCQPPAGCLLDLAEQEQPEYGRAASCTGFGPYEL